MPYKDPKEHAKALRRYRLRKKTTKNIQEEIEKLKTRLKELESFLALES